MSMKYQTNAKHNKLCSTVPFLIPKVAKLAFRMNLSTLGNRGPKINQKAKTTCKKQLPARPPPAAARRPPAWAPWGPWAYGAPWVPWVTMGPPWVPWIPRAPRRFIVCAFVGRIT